MNRHRAFAIVSLMLLVMMGLLLSCDPGLAEPGSRISLITPSLATAAATSTVVNTPTATVYYVAVNEPGASDSNNGLYPSYQGGQDGPWLTIQRAANTMTAGETTYVRGGAYYESAITFAHSGVPGAPVTLAGYEPDQVIVDGSKAQTERSRRASQVYLPLLANSRDSFGISVVRIQVCKT